MKGINLYYKHTKRWEDLKQFVRHALQDCSNLPRELSWIDNRIAGGASLDNSSPYVIVGASDSQFVFTPTEPKEGWVQWTHSNIVIGEI